MNDALVRRRIGPALVALGLNVTELCRHLMETSNAAGRGIAIVTHASPMTAAVETVVPLGLLLNELLANSLKHGFPDGRRGAITVSLAPDTDGHSVLSVADNGNDALAMARRMRPTLVLMDIVLRGPMDGIQTSLHLAHGMRIPVIFLTAHNDADTLGRAVTSAPYGYLTKPYQGPELRGAVEVALYKASLDKGLRESEHWHRAMLRCVSDGVVATDADGAISYRDPTAESLTGWTAEGAQGQPVLDVVRLAGRRSGKSIESPLLAAMRRNRPVGIEFGTHLVGRDGTAVPIDDSAAPIHDDDFSTIGTVMAFRDVSERLRIEEPLRTSEERFRSAFDHAPTGLALVSWSGGKVLQVNRALCRLLGLSSDELLASSPSSWTHPEDRSLGCEQVDRLHRGRGASVEFEKPLRRPDGQDIAVLTSVSVPEGEREPPYYVVQFHDLTARQAAEAQLAHRAHHDALTGLANRIRLNDTLERMIATTHRRGGQIALLFPDLDRFKQVNDTLGHEAGDLPLQRVAGRLREGVRETDCVARLGGDEFVIALSDMQTSQDAARVAEKQCLRIREIVEVGGRDFAPDGLKIDRSCIRDVTADDGDAAIVSTVVAMAQRLGLRTVAEGVETAAQLAFLQNEGCESCRGYLFAPAMPAAEFSRWMTARPSGRPRRSKVDR